MRLVQRGRAYVDDQSPEQIRANRGTLTEPGRESPWRDRPVDENADLFRRMRAGEFPEGARVLRAKIDMSSPNLNLRDPVMYRILHRPHQNTGDRWCIYPMYDWAHGQCDHLEGVTHSLCTLEFEDHRALYDWFPGSARGRATSAPVRVRAPQPQLHSAQQARADPSGGGGARGRLGRSPHADPAGHAAARLSGGGDSRSLPAGRRHPQGQRGGNRVPRTLRARRARRPRAAGRCASCTR